MLSNVTADDGIDILAYDAAGQRSAVWQAKFSALDEADIAALRRSLAWVSGKPGTEVSNDIASIAIVVAGAAIIQNRK